MSFQISDTISDIYLETQTVGPRITNDDIILAYKRANAYFGSNYKMPTTERESNFLVFTGVYEYPAPSDFLGWMQPLRPYGTLSPWFLNTTENELTHSDYQQNQTSFKYDRENQFLVVNAQQDIPVLINSCDSLTDNGTISIAGDGSSLIEDTQIFVEGTGSFRFLITPVGGTTTITMSGMNPIDLTDIISKGQLFANLDCPATNTANITNIRLRIGSDDTGVTNYYEMNATNSYRGSGISGIFPQIGWNPLGVTPVGSPTVSAITYAQFVITNGVTGTGGYYRLDNFFGALPTYYQLPYYSKYNVKSNAGTYQQNPTAISDTILCPEDVNDAMYYKCLEHLAVYNLLDTSRATYFANLLMPFENTLRVKYPTQERRIKSQYFKTSNSF